MPGPGREKGEAMKEIVFAELPTGEIDLIRPLWEKLKSHHLQKTVHFREYFEQKTWADRKKDLLGARVVFAPRERAYQLRYIMVRQQTDR